MVRLIGRAKAASRVGIAFMAGNLTPMRGLALATLAALPMGQPDRPETPLAIHCRNGLVKRLIASK
jgi:hypothetical protein